MRFSTTLHYPAKVRVKGRPFLWLADATESVEIEVHEPEISELAVALRWSNGPSGEVQEVRHDGVSHLCAVPPYLFERTFNNRSDPDYVRRRQAFRIAGPRARHTKDGLQTGPNSLNSGIESVAADARDAELAILKTRASRFAYANGRLWVPCPPPVMRLSPFFEGIRAHAYAATAFMPPTRFMVDVQDHEGLAAPVSRPDMIAKIIEDFQATYAGPLSRVVILDCNPSLLPSADAVMRKNLSEVLKDVHPIPTKVRALTALRAAINEGSPADILARLRNFTSTGDSMDIDQPLARFEAAWSALLDLPEPEIDAEDEAAMNARL